MAFNPFYRFRKHQKAIFAALTILCMLTFVLAGSGIGGDFFSQVTYWLGAKRRIPTVATLYGQEIREVDVQNLRAQRRLANKYMQSALQEAAIAAFRQSFQIKDSLSRKNPELARQLDFYDQYARPFEREAALQWMRDQQAADKKTEAVELLDKLIVLGRGIRLLPRPQPNRLYFGGPEKMTVPDLLDFCIWRYQADRLGIQLTHDDVSYLVNLDTQHLLSSDYLRAIENGLRQDRSVGGFTRPQLLAALADEFRVRLAQMALLGYEPGRLDGGSEALTPYEFWQFYREERTENKVTLLPIPVHRPEFLSKVTPPTEAELQSFYEEHKSQEYRPDSESAGFKQPPRIEVEWVIARADSPYFRQKAEERIKQSQALSPVGTVLGAASVLAAGGTFASAAASAAPAAFDTPLLAEYEDLKPRYPWIRSWIRAPSWLQPNFSGSIYTSMNRPENVAATVGQLLGSAGTAAPTLSTPLTYQGSAFASNGKQLETFIAAETRQRLGVATTLWLGSVNPTPFATAGLWDYADKKEEFLPLEMVKERVLENLYAKQAQQLIRDEISDLREALGNRSKLLTADDARKLLSAERPETRARLAAAFTEAPTAAGIGMAAFTAPMVPVALTVHDVTNSRLRAAAETWLAGTAPFPFTAVARAYQEKSPPLDLVRAPLEKALQGQGLEHGSTEKPRDRYDIAEDKGLKRLREAIEPQSRDTTGRRFTDLFFDESARPTFRADERGPVASSPRYRPRAAAAEDTEQALYWMTSDQPAYVPTFAEVKEKVKQRWVFEKARRLAEEEAKRIVDEARKAKGDPLPVLRDEIYKHPDWGQLIELDHIAKLVRPPVAQESRFGRDEFSRYKIPEDKVEYPSADLVKKLLDLKERGNLAIVNDQPKAIFYVAALEERSLPPQSSFYRDYAQATARGELLTKLEEENHYREKHREAALERLRQEAGLQINQEKAQEMDAGRE